MGRIVRYGSDVPPPGAQIDWSHPLAQGLLVSVAGGVVRSVARNTVTPARSAAHGIPLSGSGDNVLLANGPLLGGRPEWSVTTRFMRYNTADMGPNGAAIYSERARSGNDLLKLNATTISYHAIYRDDAGSLLNDTVVGAASKLALGPATVSFGMTIPGAWRVWEDGREVKSGTYNGTTNFTNSGIECRLGRDANDTGSSFGNGVIELLHLHTCALSASEIAWLHAEPYAMFVYERPRSWFVFGGGFGVWRRPRARVLGGGFVQ